MMEIGASREGFTFGILGRSFTQICLAFISWWFLGFGFAFGEVDGGFIGTKYFLGIDWYSDNVAQCALEYCIRGIVALFIINGGIMERASYMTYVVLAILLMVFVHPVNMSWTYGQGFLYDELDAYDFAGGFTTYFFAGVVAFVGCLFVGRRGGKSFDQHNVFKMSHPHFYLVGALLVVISILNSNGVGVYGNAAFGHLNSFLALSTASIVALKTVGWSVKDLDTNLVIGVQGGIAGAVMVADCANNLEAWAALLMGMIAGLLFWLAFILAKCFKLDDGLNVFGTFAFPGMFGAILSAFFERDLGIFYGESEMILGQIVGCLIVLAWAALFAVIIFLVLKLLGQLHETERIRSEGYANGVELTHKGFKA